MSQGMAILVAGMHRAGTSAFTRVLNLLGVALPGDLLQGSAENERGFWESRSLIALNESLLELLGSAWDDPILLTEERFRVTGVVELQSQAQSFVRSLTHPFALKDPRLCRLLPFWFKVINGCGLRPAVIIPLRHPVEVAHSLARRNGFPVEKGMLLWLTHVLEAERHSRNLRRTFVRYDHLLADWRRTATGMAEDLEHPWNPPSPTTAEAIGNFLSPSLRHHTPQSIEPGGQASKMALACWEALCRDTNAAGPTLEEARQTLERAGNLFGCAIGDSARRAHRLVELELQFDIQERMLAVSRAHTRHAVTGRHTLLANLQQQWNPTDARTAMERLTIALGHTTLYKTIRAVRLFRRSPLFDAVHYRSRSLSDVAAIRHPELHYLLLGAGTPPHPLFDPTYYRSKVGASDTCGFHPLLHFLTHPDWSCSPHPLFDPEHYMAQLGSETKLDRHPLVHYLETGADSGLSPHPLFDGAWYLSHYREVAEERVNPLIHFVETGATLGYSPSPQFDLDDYLARSPDVAESGLNALIHFVRWGRAEGRTVMPVGQFLQGHSSERVSGGNSGE